MKTKLYKYFRIALFVLLPVFISCVSDPNNPNNEKITKVKNGVYVMCEGLWHYDNSSLTRIDLDNGSVIDCFFKLANNSEKLGDLANQLIVKGDTSYIVLTTAGIIRAFNTSTGKKLDSISLGTDIMPRKMVFINDSIAYVTNLYDYSVSVLDLKHFKIINKKISVGPAPEGIDFYDHYVFAVNSGYGDYMQNVAKASTISVIDIFSGTEINNLPTGPNPIEVKVNKFNKKLYVAYYNLPSKVPAETGGIIEYDLQTLQQTRKWTLNASQLCIDNYGQKLYFVSDYGISYLDLNNTSAQPVNFIKKTNSLEKWYSITLSPDNSEIWIGNANNYQMHSEILVYDLSNPSSAKKTFTAGINPNSICFFNGK
jgi:hypothetical protein